MKRSHILVLLVIFSFVFVLLIHNYINSTYRTLAVIVVNSVNFIVALSILFGKKKLESKIAWTIFVLFVPIIGTIFYLILGVEYNRFKKFDKYDVDIDRLTQEKGSASVKVESLLSNREIVSLIQNLGYQNLMDDSKAEILTNGDEKYGRLLEELEKAEKFIHLEYFIIKEGIIWDAIRSILIRKAQEGVEVRLLYDDFGCLDFSDKMVKDLRPYGIETACFNPITFRLIRPSVNYRNHRKIVVIDNKVGFTGGINIGDEYAHLDPYYGFWRDTHIVLSGKVVRQLNMIFLKDWYHTTNVLLLNTKYLAIYPVLNKKSAMTVLGDGPDDAVDRLRKIYFQLITKAKKKVWVTTPYLILDGDLLEALQVAALSGVDVRIIVPGLFDKGKEMIYKATEAYFSDLLQNGVKIYKYRDHFIHSKVLLIDDDIASIGTINMDYRSFDLHFEDTVLLFKDASIEKLRQDFLEDLEVSDEVKWSLWQRRNVKEKALESMVRIFSPLL